MKRPRLSIWLLGISMGANLFLGFVLTMKQSALRSNERNSGDLLGDIPGLGRNDRVESSPGSAATPATGAWTADSIRRSLDEAGFPDWVIFGALQGYVLRTTGYLELEKAAARKWEEGSDDARARMPAVGEEVNRQLAALAAELPRALPEPSTDLEILRRLQYGDLSGSELEMIKVLEATYTADLSRATKADAIARYFRFEEAVRNALPDSMAEDYLMYNSTVKSPARDVQDLLYKADIEVPREVFLQLNESSRGYYKAALESAQDPGAWIQARTSLFEDLHARVGDDAFLRMVGTATMAELPAFSTALSGNTDRLLASFDVAPANRVTLFFLIAEGLASIASASPEEKASRVSQLEARISEAGVLDQQQTELYRASSIPRSIAVFAAAGE